MNYQQHALALQGGKPLVSKIPAHLRYTGVFNLLLGMALLAALAYTATLLQKASETSSHLAAKVDKLEQQYGKSAAGKPLATMADFCPFPFNPSNPGCQMEVAANGSQQEPQSVADAPPAMNSQPAVTGEAKSMTPLGWIYAGRNTLQSVIQMQEESLLIGKVYTLLQNLNVRRLPASSKTAENHQVLSTVFAGEQVRVLAMENTGEHLWLQIAPLITKKH